MVNYEKLAKLAMYGGGLALIGTLAQPNPLAAYPGTIATCVLLILPYPYLQFRKGYSGGRQSPAAD